MAYLNKKEMELCSRWFSTVQDLNPHYLQAEDYALAVRLYTLLKLPIPPKIAERNILCKNSALA